MSRRIPGVALFYGLAGLIPFWAPLLAAWAPDWRALAVRGLGFYGALILSFLGGGRWGFAVAQTPPPAGRVSLSMLPPLVGLALLLLPDARARLIGLAAALLLQWAWDALGRDVPDWYPRLRTILTTGAAAGLLAGAFVLA